MVPLRRIIKKKKNQFYLQHFNYFISIQKKKIRFFISVYCMRDFDLLFIHIFDINCFGNNKEISANQDYYKLYS